MARHPLTLLARADGSRIDLGLDLNVESTARTDHGEAIAPDRRQVSFRHQDMDIDVCPTQHARKQAAYAARKQAAYAARTNHSYSHRNFPKTKLPVLSAGVAMRITRGATSECFAQAPWIRSSSYSSAVISPFLRTSRRLPAYQQTSARREGDEHAFMAAIGVEVRLPPRQLVSISPAAPAPVSINGDDLGGVFESEFQRNPVLPVGQCGLSCAIVDRAPLHTRARKQRGRIPDRLRKVAMQRGRVELGPAHVAFGTRRGTLSSLHKNLSGTSRIRNSRD
jgi:hypothetical protein